MFTESLQTNLPHIQTIQVIHFKNYINHYPGERGRRNISSWTWRTSCWFCWWAPWWSTLVSSPQVLLSLELELWHPALSAVYATQCYNCGYRILNGGEPEALPEGDLKYCSDFANPNDIVTDCSQPSDCCASMKELIVRYPQSPLNVWWHDNMWCSESTRPQAPTPPNWSRNTAAGLTWERWRGDITTAVSTQTPAST